MRVSLFGGGTDYPAWWRKNGGSVLGFAINKYTRVYVRDLLPFYAHKHMIVYRKVEMVDRIADIEHPAVRAVLQEHWGDDRGGLEITHMGDIPAMSGMGSSSSFVVALLAAIVHKTGVKGINIAREAIRIEQDVIGENVGNQDQVWAAKGGFNRINFYRDGQMSLHPLGATRRGQDLLAHLMLVFTGFTRLADEIAGDQVREMDRHAEDLWEIQRMVDEAEDIICSGQEDIRDIGPLLYKSWERKRNLAARVSNPDIDAMLEAAMNAGALGGKLLGAGNGGFLLLFAEPEKQERVKADLGNRIWVPLGIDHVGVSIREED